MVRVITYLKSSSLLYKTTPEGRRGRSFPVEVLSLGLHFVAGSEDVLARLASLRMLRVRESMHDTCLPGGTLPCFRIIRLLRILRVLRIIRSLPQLQSGDVHRSKQKQAWSALAAYQSH